MAPRLRLGLVLATLGVLGLGAACEPGRPVRAGFGRSSGGRDAAALADAGPVADAGSGEAGTPTDAGTPSDTGATGRDAAAPPDAGPLDLGAALDAAAPDAGPVDTGVPPLVYCREGCASLADCVQDSPLYDADNYVCQRGVCEWTGCRSDAECRAATSNSDYGCTTIPGGGGLTTCVKRCAQAVDCTTGSGRPLDRAHNWRCSGGWCESLGCLDDAECRESTGDPSYACRVYPGTTQRSCQRTCAMPIDCAQPSAAFDADNWRCSAGLCIYDGCRSDAECAATFMSSEFVCR